jgi:hypothetical protein
LLVQMIQHKPRARVSGNALHLTANIPPPSSLLKKQGRHEIRRKTAQRAILTAKMGGRRRGVVMLTQPAVFASLIMQLAPPSPVGLRRDRRYWGK